MAHIDNLEAHSNDVCLMHAAAADCCILLELGSFLIF